ncbi:hypothetical protein BGW38_001109 [Lunasporangiospora selenospora]|uniref:Dynamin family protein n=1 Tax=Lunasporangiospora selenospora TaxID=979761 RepID=A0A9P6FUB9_9FUNG|nr:hypothetical protein BGW38_001109 [Lunasporangiospora selenospora]
MTSQSSHSTTFFEKTEYQSLIDKINKIRGYGLSKILTIPQIAILGDQSSGKSSVLEAITQLSFPRNKDTCTRFATQVNLRQTIRREMMAYIDGEDEFNEQYQALQDASWNIHKIVSDANEILCDNTDISEKVLEITISGPNLAPLTVIDLPGYINTTIDGQDKTIIKTIHDINTKYIKDTRTIILAVVPANIDLNNMYVLSEAERYDPNFERTVPIVTKPDTVEPDLLPSLIEILLNKRKYMKLGYLVMRNSGFKDIDMSWDEAKQKEDQFFKSSPLWNQVPECRKGRISVKNLLGDLLYSHIKNELPQLRKEILGLIGNVEMEIRDLGHPITSLGTARVRYIDHILKLRSSLTALLNGQYTTEYIHSHKVLLKYPKPKVLSKYPKPKEETQSDEDSIKDGHNNGGNDIESDIGLGLELTTDNPTHYYVRSQLQKLYQSYNASMKTNQHVLSNIRIKELVLLYKGNELPGFISFNTLTQIYSETLVQWKAITKEHMGNVHLYINKVIAELIVKTADPLLSDLLLSEFDQFYKIQVSLINETIQDIFEDESIPFTMNKYYYDTILSLRKANAEDTIKEKANRLQGTARSSQDIQRFLATFDEVEKMDEINYNENLAVNDLEEKLVSYCKVARKRIVDTVLLQTIERQMINRINRYFDKLITVDDTAISSRLIEPPAKMMRREELQTKVDVLQKSLREL